MTIADLGRNLCSGLSSRPIPAVPGRFCREGLGGHGTVASIGLTNFLFFIPRWTMGLLAKRLSQTSGYRSLTSVTIPSSTGWIYNARNVMNGPHNHLWLSEQLKGPGHE